MSVSSFHAVALPSVVHRYQTTQFSFEQITGLFRIGLRGSQRVRVLGINRYLRSWINIAPIPVPLRLIVAQVLFGPRYAKRRAGRKWLSQK
jgi:hypothetical protein